MKNLLRLIFGVLLLGVVDVYGATQPTPVILYDTNGNPYVVGGAGDGAVVDGVTPSIKATVKDYTNSNPMAIIPVDTNGDPASLSGGTQYDQGTAATDTDKLMMMGCVRTDTAAVATGVANLDRARCIIDSVGRVWVYPTGSATPAASFANPTNAITVWALNACRNADTTWDPCPKADAGAGNTTSATQRVVIAKDSAVCNAKDTAQAVISTATSGNVELVALTSGQTIYVCDFTLVSTGTVAVQLVYGTGTACGTGETNMTGAMPFVANGGWTHNYDGRLKTAEANALCIELSAATQVDGVVTYRKAATF